MSAITVAKKALRRVVRETRAHFVEDPIERAGLSGFFGPGDIDEVMKVVLDEGSAAGTRFDALRHAHMRLPEWFKPGLDPWGAAYAEQQQRLWQLVSGVERPYDPEVDEKEAPVGEVDAVRFPAYFLRRDPLAVASASDHVIAGGMILKHSGLKPGDRALEYGAGFGQTALTLARLGVNVDTVDISRTFCRHVQTQADFFQVPLKAHVGRFGMNPRPGQRYDLVWFYESFHHCVDFFALMRALPGLLAEGGRVILCGEPMAEREYAAVPYPWGVRLHSEVVAMVRRYHWFELGFSEDFLYELFSAHGFTIERVACEPTLWGRLYLCQRRPNELPLARTWLPPAIEDGWHAAQPDGRWTRGEATLCLDAAPGTSHVELEFSNPLRTSTWLRIEVGAWSDSVRLRPGERRTVRWPANGSRRVRLSSPERHAGLVARMRRSPLRRVGVLVHALRYMSPDPPAQDPPTPNSSPSKAAMRESFFADCSAYLERLRRADSFDSISRLWRETSIPYTMQSADPHSQAYRDEVLAVYAGLTQGRYDLNNELTSNHQSAADFEVGYPWISRNLEVVSQELVKTVQALRALHRGASGVQEIIEFGCGWGNLAVPLVKAGQRVTVIDIDENFLRRVRAMVEREGLEIETVHADFVEGAGRVGRRFDVAVFQSSFHHCLEFEELLQRLRDSVLKDDGRILFVSEPVMPGLPFPWGLRYDGESLWAIMCNKWLELGFDEQFFLQLLHRHGFFLSRVDEVPGMVGPGWQATRMTGGIQFADWVLPHTHEAGFWAAASEKAYGRFLRDSARLPALPAVAPAYQLELHNYGPRPLRLRLRCGKSGWDTVRLESNERRTVLAPAAEGAELELDCETFVPDQLVGNGDTRRIGLALVRVSAPAPGQANG